MQKKWADAEKLYDEILLKYPNSEAHRRRFTGRPVSHYKDTNDHTVLGESRKHSAEYPIAFGKEGNSLGGLTRLCTSP